MKRLPAPHPAVRQLTIAALALSAAILTSSCRSSNPPPARPQPAPPGTPVAAPITGQIGTAGGTLATPDGRLTVHVPAGAVASTTQLSIREITNTAPRGYGSAYLLEPAGVVFRHPVAITFDAKSVGAPIENVGIAFQDATGFWTPVPSVLRNRQAQLITAQSPHFSAWALVPTNPSLDLAGSFTITSNLDLPFTAVGNASAGYAGEDSNERYYLLSGTTTLQSPVTYEGATCSPPAPDASGVTPNPAAVYALPSNLVEGFKLASDPTSYSKVWWGTSAHWNLACGTNSPYLLEFAFDTGGINYLRCARGYTAGTTPVLTQDQMTGDYTIDCTGVGSGGTVRGTWSWVRCGGTCTSTNPCATASSYTCTSTGPVCTVTQTATPGTYCTTSSNTAGVCNTAGTCIACTQGADCTSTAQATDPCVATATIDCSTGQEQCIPKTYVAAGTSCTTSTGAAGTCSPSSSGSPSTCVACSQGADCTSTLTASNPCVLSANIQCGSGAPVCTVQQYQPAGTTCTTSSGGPGTCSPSGPGTPSTCVSCDPTASCTSNNECAATTITDCRTGVPTCDVLTYKTAGTPCGLVNGTYTGVCSNTTPSTCTACTQGADCSSQYAGNTCVQSASIDCTSGAPVCTPIYKQPGASCGTGTEYCSNTSPPVCTACPATCTVSDPCVATTQSDCTSGTPTCTITSYSPPGTSCGTATSPAYCNSATPPACVACVVGSSCSPTYSSACIDPNATWTVTSCGTNGPVCSPSAFLPDGTDCGGGSFCLSGVCTSTCTAQACIPSTNPCDAGTISCAVPTSCVDTGVSVAAGTVCNAATGATCAACVTSSCTLGMACGTGTCIASSPTTVAPDGSVCNPTTGAICTAGQCCGSSCVTANCTTGTVACSAGTATCVDSGTNTSVCTGTQVCNGVGVCQ